MHTTVTGIPLFRKVQKFIVMNAGEKLGNVEFFVKNIFATNLLLRCVILRCLKYIKTHQRF